MKHFRENLVVQFSVVSFGIMFALALGLSAILTARLDENVDLLRDHGVAMMSGTMIMDSAPFSIPSIFSFR